MIVNLLPGSVAPSDDVRPVLGGAYRQQFSDELPFDDHRPRQLVGNCLG